MRKVRFYLEGGANVVVDLAALNSEHIEFHAACLRWRADGYIALSPIAHIPYEKVVFIVDERDNMPSSVNVEGMIKQ